MKNRLTEAFMDQLKSKASKDSSKKSLFIDASYERNTKSFQMHQQKPGRVRSLTLGEVSREIHNLKVEISTMKSQIAELKKGKQMAKEEEDNDQPWDTAPYSSNQEIQVAEGIKDPNFGFRDMRFITISYQQHHVKVNVYIKSQMFEMVALLDSGADINILNMKNIPAKY